MTQKVKEKYLGDYFHCRGLAASAKVTFEARALTLKAGAVEVLLKTVGVDVWVAWM